MSSQFTFSSQPTGPVILPGTHASCLSVYSTPLYASIPALLTITNHLEPCHRHCTAAKALPCNPSQILIALTHPTPLKNWLKLCLGAARPVQWSLLTTIHLRHHPQSLPLLYLLLLHAITGSSVTCPPPIAPFPSGAPVWPLVAATAASSCSVRAQGTLWLTHWHC